MLAWGQRVLALRTAVVDHHEIDVAGLTAVPGRFGDRIRLVAPDDPTAMVVLYGARELEPVHDARLHALLRSSRATVIVLGWGPDTPQVA